MVNAMGIRSHMFSYGCRVWLMGCVCWLGITVSSLAGAPSAELSIVPQPVSLTPQPGCFTLSERARLAVDRQDAGALASAQYLADLLGPATGCQIEWVDLPAEQKRGPVARLVSRFKSEPDFLFALDSQRAGLGEEGYALEVTPGQVRLEAATGAGLFYAVQTLRQLLPPRVECKEPQLMPQWTIPCVSIVDRPRFAWRGMHLDVCRHFFGKEFILKYLDAMALYKLNTFHWHLTEDDGWRIEIKKYPRLAQVGGLRGPQGNQYGGYYTQEDIREIVAYAQARHITIIPEIEMPGHCNAALYAYPELTCDGQPPAVGGDDSRMYYMAGGRQAFCAGQEHTFEFLQDVLTEVMDLFPSPIIHIGGDERPEHAWVDCPRCQERMRREGFTSTAQLQEYFVVRVQDFLRAHGRRMIGWEQILTWEGYDSTKLAPDTLIMSYFDPASSLAAARRGHDVVAAYAGNCYFDFHQSLWPGEPQAINGLTTLESAYLFEPVLPGATADEAAHILGGQGCLWTEYVPTAQHAEYMTFPRLCALAEALWSPRTARDWPSFARCLPAQLGRLDRLGINYRHPRPEDLP